MRHVNAFGEDWVPELIFCFSGEIILRRSGSATIIMLRINSLFSPKQLWAGYWLMTIGRIGFRSRE